MDKGTSFTHRHLSDVERIHEVYQKNGIPVSLDTSAQIWDTHSDNYAAGWLGLPDDDEELWYILKNLYNSQDIDYRELLKKYMHHIWDKEGYTFLESHSFSDTEIAELKSIEAEI